MANNHQFNQNALEAAQLHPVNGEYPYLKLEEQRMNSMKLEYNFPSAVSWGLIQGECLDYHDI